MMTPELSRWLAKVVNSPHFQNDTELRNRLRAGALSDGWETIDDLPEDLRELGLTALRHGRHRIGTR